MMHIEIESGLSFYSECVHICFCLFVNWIYLHNFIVSTARAMFSKSRMYKDLEINIRGGHFFIDKYILGQSMFLRAIFGTHRKFASQVKYYHCMKGLTPRGSKS